MEHTSMDEGMEITVLYLAADSGVDVPLRTLLLWASRYGGAMNGARFRVSSTPKLRIRQVQSQRLRCFDRAGNRREVAAHEVSIAILADIS
jgi:hypothetical protein